MDFSSLRSVLCVRSNRKQCIGGFPLQIRVASSENATLQEDRPLEKAVTVSLIKKLKWDAFVQTANSLGLDLPPTLSESDLEDEHVLKAVQNAMLDFHILEGTLICPECKREYPIAKGIPNMLLNDDEV